MKKIKHCFVFLLLQLICLQSYANNDSRVEMLTEDGILASIDCPPVTTDVNVPVYKCPTFSNVNMGDILTVSTCLPLSSNGEVLVDADNCFSYSPSSNFAGLDSFCLMVCDQFDVCESTIVNVCVTPAPNIEGDLSVCPGETVTYNVAEFNPDNTYTFTLSNNGTVIDQSNGSITIEWDDEPGEMSQLVVEEDAGAECSGVGFANIIIEDDLPLSCNGSVNISLSNSCQATITPDMVLEGAEYPDDSYTVILVDENGNQLPNNTVDGSFINEELEVQIIHDCTGNYCWGTITIEDKIATGLICPESDTLTCDEYASFVIPTPLLDGVGCGDETIETTTQETIGDCDDEFAFILTITQVSIDQSGNESLPCVYSIYVEKEDINDIDLPLNYDGLAGNNEPLSCDGGFATDDNGLPSPSVTGEPGGVGTCINVSVTYEDTVLPICETDCDVDLSSYKVIREWYLIEWCTSTVLEYTQVIKVMDNVPPVISPIDDFTISTDSWECSATIPLPQIFATDNCSAEESIRYTFTSTEGVQVGNTFVIADPAVTTPGAPIEIVVTAEDCCGNTSSTSFEVIIEDNIPPVVIAETHHTTSLTLDGVAKIFAEDLDDGSHDNCGPIAFFAKRMDNGGGCPSYDEFPPAGNDNAQYNEAVFFCCNDIGDDPVMVQFQVCDDGNKDGIIGNVGDNCNIAMIEVFVQDKLLPVIICPDDMTINCNAISTLDLTDNQVLNNMFGSANAAGTCNVSITQNATGVENCGAGTIFRNFTATNTGGSATCTQIITVEAGTTGLLTCNRITFSNLNNNTYNWCAVNDNVNNNNDDLPSLVIDCNDGLAIPELDINIDGLCTEAGVQIEVDTFNFAGGGCKKYLIHYEVIDQCIFDENFVDPETGEIDPFNSLNGYFEFYLEVDAFDSEAPQLDCSPVVLAGTDCEGYDGPITVPGSDNCTDEEFFGYQWRIDLYNDGTYDYPATSFASSSAVTPAILGLPGIPTGTHTILWLVSDGCGNDATCAQLVTITGEEKAPTPYCIDGLATAVMPSTGTVALWANDFDAGSFDNCEGPLEFTMLPEVDATGLTNEESYDLSFVHPNVTQQPNGDYGFQFDCSYIPNGISAVLEIRVFVTDQNGNWDFCTASLRIDDNFDACENNGTGMLTIDGEIFTKEANPIELVDVKLEADFPEFPMSQITQDDGLFDFINLYENIDYTVTPSRNDNHLNGITTLDIVLIQKHILGLAPITDPYLLIAADVNNDCLVNGQDLIQIRRLLLGKYLDDQFPNNSSWRFVSDNQEFIDGQQPCVYLEQAELINLAESVTENFTGVKIGDINNTVSSNATATAETRTDENLPFIIENRGLLAGEMYEINFLASDFNEVYGYQFTLNFEGLQYISTQSGALEITEANIGLRNLENNKIAFSYDNSRGATLDDETVLFTISVKVMENNDISNMIAISSEELKAEAYVQNSLEIVEPTIEFRNNIVENQQLDFALAQNEPNPFKEQTVIEFDLPKTDEATFTVYDATGKVVFMKIDTYAKGNNKITLTRADINATGALFYKLESGDFTATKRMIIID